MSDFPSAAQSVFTNRDDRVRWAIYEASKGYVLAVQPATPLGPHQMKATGPTRRYGADTLEDAIEAVKDQGLPHGKNWYL